MKERIIFNSLYFKAYIKREQVVHFIGLLRSMEDNIVFDRIENPETNIWEFFVSVNAKDRFCQIMDLLTQQELVLWYREESIKKSSLY